MNKVELMFYTWYTWICHRSFSTNRDFGCFFAHQAKGPLAPTRACRMWPWGCWSPSATNMSRTASAMQISGRWRPTWPLRWGTKFIGKKQHVCGDVWCWDNFRVWSIMKQAVKSYHTSIYQIFVVCFWFGQRMIAFSLDFWDISRKTMVWWR